MTFETKVKLPLTFAGLLLLNGCAGIELVHLAGQTLTQELSTIARAKSDIETKIGIRVYAIEMFEQRPMWVTPCEYTGVLVEYARDWDELDELGHVVRMAEPSKPAGYALLLNKEMCPDKEPENILKTGTRSGLISEYVIRKGHGHIAMNYLSTNSDMRPKWMPQVIETIKTEATTNPAAAHFLAEMQARSDTDIFR